MRISSGHLPRQDWNVARGSAPRQGPRGNRDEDAKKVWLVPRKATFAAIQAAKRLRLAAKGVGTGAEGDALTFLGGAISVATVPLRVRRLPAALRCLLSLA